MTLKNELQVTGVGDDPQILILKLLIVLPNADKLFTFPTFSHALS